MWKTLTGEYRDTWNDRDVIKWKKTSLEMQTLFYNLFGNVQFDEYQEMSTSQQISKICFAIFGPPVDESIDIESAYSRNQRQSAADILNKIKEVWKTCAERRKLCIGIIFVCCKQDDKEYTVPIFRLLCQVKYNKYISKYIDTSCRVYECWNDWEKNNTMPMMKYCYPKNGVYSCSPIYPVFDAKKKPQIVYGTSPACDLINRFFRVSDVLVTTTGITLGLVSMFTPVGLASMTIIGGSSLYNFGRAGQRLCDKSNHGESLKDLESIVLFASMIAVPLTFLSCAVNAKLATGAVQGRVFSESTRVLATVLFCTTFGFDSFFLLVNISNLIQKHLHDQLTALDVVQFSISCLFFTNTIIQPKTARGVIEKAQNQRIDQIANGLTDQQAKMAFDKFLKDNKQGNIMDNSKIIRTLNKIENPAMFFKNNSNNKIMIGGRRGRTVFVTDSMNNKQRINPNSKVISSQQLQQGTPKIQKPGKLKNCLGTEYDKHKYLKNMNDRQKGRVSKVFGGSANYDKDIVDIATRVSDDLRVENADQFMSVVEMVAAEHKKHPGKQLNGRDYVSFVNGVRDDLTKAATIAAKRNKSFADPYLAAYHYRKHGEEFVNNCTIDFYLGKNPGRIMNTGRLTEVCRIENVQPNGESIFVERKTYFTSNDDMCVIIEHPGKQTISTMFKNIGGWQKHLDKFPITNIAPDIKVSTTEFAQSIGLQNVTVQIHDSNGIFDAEKYGISCRDAQYYQNQIALLLSDLAAHQ